VGVKLGSLALRKEHKLTVPDKRVTMREEVAEGWRKLHEDLHNLHYSPSGVIAWSMACTVLDSERTGIAGSKPAQGMA
jgi:hypothetical protein